MGKREGDVVSTSAVQPHAHLRAESLAGLQAEQVHCAVAGAANDDLGCRGRGVGEVIHVVYVRLVSIRLRPVDAMHRHLYFTASNNSGIQAA